MEDFSEMDIRLKSLYIAELQLELFEEEPD
jgi:hypothetical protein